MYTNDLQSPEIQQLLAGGFKLTPLTLGMRLSGGKYKAAKHLAHVAAIIANAINVGNARIIITMPPRHGKSELCSHYLPTWFLERWPSKRVILGTYGAELSRYFSRKVRDTIESSGEHLSVRLRDDASGVNDFLTTEQGGMLAAGILGPITGRGFDLGLIDDYVKNSEDSLSLTQLQKVWDWFLSTFYTRREPDASIVIFATRWNVNDLIAKCKRDLSHENWIVINLPANAEEDDPLGRPLGDPLWPERYNLNELAKIKQTLGNYWWSAMYQQAPRESMLDADRGNKVTILDPQQLPHTSDLKIIRAWDFAATEVPIAVTETTSSDPDYTVGIKLAMSKMTGRYYIIDVDRFREGPYKAQIRVRSIAELDGLNTPIVLEQEPGASGKTFVENYTTQVLPGWSVIGVHPTGPLEFRASPFLAMVEAGKVSMLRAPWNSAILHELNTFPSKGAHDDIISAGSLAFNKLTLGIQGSVTWGEMTPGQLNQIITKNLLYPTKREGMIKGVTW